MKSKQGKFILSIVIVVVIVIALGFILNNKSVTGPGKYDDFAKACNDLIAIVTAQRLNMSRQVTKAGKLLSFLLGAGHNNLHE